MDKISPKIGLILNFKEVFMMVDFTFISDLENHFTKYYNILVEAKTFNDASTSTICGLTRTVAGYHMPYCNMVMGEPKGNQDTLIQEQIDFFKSHNLPFVWYVDIGATPAFKEKLESYGFKDTGIFKGVSGPLGTIAPVDSEIAIEEVQDDKTMDAFISVIGDMFNLQGADRESYKQAMKHEKIRNFVVKKEGKVVSCLSTLTDGNFISFWNGATLPEYRKQGLSTALRRYVLHNRPKNCTQGASYLMAEGMALGICEKLGYTTKWQFHAYVLTAL